MLAAQIAEVLHHTTCRLGFYIPLNRSGVQAFVGRSKSDFLNSSNFAGILLSDSRVLQFATIEPISRSPSPSRCAVATGLAALGLLARLNRLSAKPLHQMPGGPPCGRLFV